MRRGSKSFEKYDIYAIQNLQPRLHGHVTHIDCHIDCLAAWFYYSTNSSLNQPVWNEIEAFQVQKSMFVVFSTNSVIKMFDSIEFMKNPFGLAITRSGLALCTTTQMSSPS